MDKKFPPGIRCFPKHQNAPDFVLCSLVITLDDLISGLKADPSILTEYNGKKQLKVQLLNSQAGAPYAVIDTYKKGEPQKTAPAPQKPFESNLDGLPF